MSDVNFLDVQLNAETYKLNIQRAEQYLQALNEDLKNLKNVENPTQAHQILLKLYTDKLVDAIKILN